MPEVESYTIGSVFRNQRGQDITIKKRLWTPEDKVHYIMKATNNKMARVPHETVLDQLKENIWVEKKVQKSVTILK